MSHLKRFILRLSTVFRAGPAERQLSRELDAHLRLMQDDFERRGLAPEDARIAARRAFGGVDQTKEQQRDARSFIWLEDARRDVVYGLRSLRRAPGFTAIALLTIGLGVGANLAIFSLVNTVLLKTIPVREPGELFFLGVTRASGRVGGAPPYPCYEIVRDRSHAFSGLAAFNFDGLTLIVDGRPERVMGQQASGSYFDVLGVKPAIGRTLVAADDADPAVAVLGYDYWQRRFGGDVNVLGRTVIYEDHPLTVVGVTEKAFRGLEPGISVDITIPFTIVGPGVLSQKGRWWFGAVGRLAPGVSAQQAIAEIDPLFQAFKHDSGMPAGEQKMFVRLTLRPAVRGLDSMREEFSRPLLLLMGIAGIALIITCANVANLLLARSATRRHEFATRVAIGASRGRLVRQLVTESLLLGSAGSLLGVPLAYWLVQALTGAIGGGPYPRVLDLAPDYRMVTFAVALSVATSVLFGLAPAVRAARLGIVEDLKHARGAFVRRLIPSSGSSLMVTQIALSLVLAVVMSLMVRTVAGLKGLDTGFRAANVAIFDVELLDHREAAGTLPAKWMPVIERLNGMPGVESVALSWLTPLSMRNRGVAIRVLHPAADVSGSQSIALNHISPAFFATLGIPLRAGRAFTDRDDAGAPPVAIFSETAAGFFFGGTSAIGQRVVLFKREYEIVGVAGDTKHLSLRDEIPRFIYVPILQPVDRLTGLMLSARLAPFSAGGIEAIRREIGRSGASIVVGHATTLEQQVDRSLITERMVARVSGIFGVMGLVLAAVGLFGVMSFRVIAKGREIAIRMALGASAPSVRWSTLRESLRVAAFGVALGVPLSLAAGRALTSMLFGVSPTSLPIFGGCVAMLLIVSVIAGYLPARRASRVDPMTILRAE